MHIVIKMESLKTIEKEWKSLEQVIDIPDGIIVSVEKSILKVKGPKGEVSKLMKYPNVYVKVEDNKIKIGTLKFSKRQKKIIFTFVAHTNNLINGVIDGFTYELRVVYSKFPITISFKNGIFEVKNLLGEKVPRRVKVSSDVKIEIKGSDIIVSGIDKELVGQTAANLEQLCRITHLDRRVVQDGIYIIKKPLRVFS